MSREIKMAGVEVFVDGTSPFILSKAKRLADKELWNAPQVHIRPLASFVVALTYRSLHE